MTLLPAVLALLVCQMSSASWAVGLADCSAPSSSVLSLLTPMEEVNGWHDGEAVVVEGTVQPVAGAHGHRAFFIQSDGGGADAEVLVLSPSDVDMSMHEGMVVRVEGTLDMSTSSGLTILLLPPRNLQEVVKVCHRPSQGRNLRMNGNAVHPTRGYYSFKSFGVLFPKASKGNR